MKKATLTDCNSIAQMLYKMYNELQPELSSKDIDDYISLAKKHITDDFVYIEESEKGMYIVRDVSSTVINKKIYDGVSVYIEKEFRKSRILSDMYAHMFKTFTGTIIGFTEYNSEHNNVLIKRHKLLGYVYELNRS
jgi:hypothetical protein